MKINDGGPAFPVTACTDPGDAGMSLRDYFAIHAPQPDATRIASERNRDRARNPHNDYYKPRIRSDMEIECDLRFEFADAMLKARETTND